MTWAAWRRSTKAQPGSDGAAALLAAGISRQAASQLADGLVEAW